MKKLLLASVVALLPAAGFAAENALSYAYPVAPQGLPQPDPNQKHQAKGTPTGMQLTFREINNQFGPPDWFPNEHPPMPSVVKNGRPSHVRACMLCHLPHGNGHPESASVGGLPADYIVDQMHAFRDGTRTNNRVAAMVEMAKDITEAELKEAADYFASIPRDKQLWIKVIETANAPENEVGPGGARFLVEGSTKTMPVGPTQIYEVAEDGEGVELRDQHAGFLAFVPVGSIAKGKELATTGGNGKSVQCSICHGSDYRGIGNVPRIAGRAPYYMIRQLADMRSGARHGKNMQLMVQVVANLTDEDIVNLTAYLASLDP